MKRIELTIENIKDGLDIISLVEEPAIEVDFFYFNKTKPRLFKFDIDTEEMKLTGPSMIPDLDILRLDGNNDPYLVYFSKKTVEEAAVNFFKNSNVNETNINHEDDIIEGVTVFESWIVDKENGKGGGKNFEDIQDGTWMISYKIDNKDIWNNYIKTGKIRGFSIQGQFTSIDSGDNEDLLMKQIDELMSEGLNENEIYDKLKDLLN